MTPPEINVVGRIGIATFHERADIPAALAEAERLLSIGGKRPAGQQLQPCLTLHAPAQFDQRTGVRVMVKFSSPALPPDGECMTL